MFKAPDGIDDDKLPGFRVYRSVSTRHALVSGMALCEACDSRYFRRRCGPATKARLHELLVAEAILDVGERRGVKRNVAETRSRTEIEMTRAEADN